MLVPLFIKGIIIGLAVSVPLGPIGVLIIQRTINKNRISGFLTGVGASLTDVFYALIAGFSLTYVIDFIRVHHFSFHILGALIVFLLGAYIYRKNPVHDMRKYRRKGSTYYQDLISSFLITFPNPLVVFIFLAVFASSGIVFHTSQPYQAFVLIFGIFIGASLWWLTLTNVVSWFKHKFSLRVLWWFNKISGALIMLLVLVSFFVSFKAAIL
ncbi:MAG: LysE family translocator [Mangrovibacterium sp.]|jgi:threonine/homoserine/homoserine lactone efflux protein